MADLTNVGLDPNVPENSGGFVLIPEGRYRAVIVGDRLVSTKDTTGKILELKVQLVDGQHAGQTVVDRINIINKSAQAQAIGQGQLRRICGLTGCPFPPSDTTMMHGKPIEITVKIESFTSNTTGKMLESNKISGYNPVPATPAKPASPASAW